jgi:proteasome-associated ATPase
VKETGQKLFKRKEIMNSDKKKDAKKTAKKVQKVVDVDLEELETIVRDAQEAKQKAEEKGTIEEILREAEQATRKPAEETGQKEDELRKKIGESEAKRLILAESLAQARGEMHQMMPGQGENWDRANPFGVYVGPGRSPETVIIKHNGRLYESEIIPESEDGPANRTVQAVSSMLQPKEIMEKAEKEKMSSAEKRKRFKKGEFLLLNNDLHVIESRGFDLFCGSLGTISQILNDEKLLVRGVGDETFVLTRAHPLMGVTILLGDNIEYDPDSGFAYSLLPKSEVDRLALEKVPDIGYENIGGLDEAIHVIRDSIELPHLYPEYFEEHQLMPPKGILLYGPPGCGKTLIAKAVANALARSITEKTGEKGESFFLNVKGPELLNKYVGETEQAIRDLFARARNRSSYKTPVIIFFDEMDSMFRVRGSGISSDMESTIVPQFLSELDGLEVLENVVVIGASNREDLIDPAILRPGRLDRKVRVPRPDKQGAKDIFYKYLLPDLPLERSLVEDHGGPEETVQWMIDEVVEEMYSLKTENELLEIFYADGSKKILYMKDFSSGAIIENIVSRAKFEAVKALIDKGKRGITYEFLVNSLKEEYKENEDLPSNTNPAEWYRIIGKGGERVIRIRSLLGDEKKEKPVKDKPKHMAEVGAGLR